MIVIVDYGVGNVGSVLNMLRKCGARARISGHPEEIRAADKLILPGVGHFGRGMDQLEATGLIPLLTEQAMVVRKPLLGICLGMQLMLCGSEESDRPGLGWVAGFTHRFPDRPDLLVPHMGWNLIHPRAGARMFAPPGVEPRERFYFVHSYHACMDDARSVAATCRYGIEFTAAFEVGNLFGVQFHPEKSHHFGMALLQRFASP